MSSLMEVVDMLGRKVLIPAAIQRVVSLVPSQTEFLYELGLKDLIVGQTVFCVHPKAHFKKACKVGGTKKLKYDVIEELNPDLIICNKEENTEEIVAKLSEKYPVWVSDIKTVEDAYLMMQQVAQILNRSKEAEVIIKQIKDSFKQRKIRHQYTCLYLIWRNPYMAVGPDTFINHLLEKSGFYNLIHEQRYPELDAEAIAAHRPEVVLLSSEPYPFKEKHIEELQKILPYSKILMVDGELFSWYGSRLVNSQPYFNELQRQLHKIKK